MEEYDSFICLSEEAKEKLGCMSEDELNIMCALLASSINESVTHRAIDKKRDGMKDRHNTNFIWIIFIIMLMVIYFFPSLMDMTPYALHKRITALENRGKE